MEEIESTERQPGEPGPVGFARVLRYFLWLGTFGFGGPIATVGYMQRDLVERRGWLGRGEFLDGVALGQTMPGPLAAQVVMWVGFLRAGALGALASAVAFIVTSFVGVLAIAVLYVRYQGLDWVQALFYGIAPGVMAIIAVAAVKLARLTNGADVRLWVISAITLVITAVTGAEIALLFVAAGLIMMLWEVRPKLPRGGGASALVAMPMAQMAGAVPLAAETYVALGLFFLKAGAFIFGSGLAIVPFLREGVVDEHGWLTERQFLDAVAMGLITPGPVVITATFIGYLVAGFAGAAIATVAIFLPIYLGVVVPGPWFIRHRSHPRLQGFVKGATAAAAGAIGGATIVLTRGAVVDIPTAVIALAGLAFVLRFKNREPVLVVLAGVAGLLLF
jgi:chromate transporter